MFTFTRLLAASAAALLLSLTAQAQPLDSQPGKPAPASRQQTAPAKGQPLAMATVRAAEPAAAAAPETVVLRGVVLRADGQPLPGAGVYVAGLAKQLVVTDEQGAFALPVPTGRQVAVLADYFGLGSTRVSVSLPLAQPLRITVGN